MKSLRILLLGAGKMGGAMLDGWLHRGVKPANVVVVDPSPSPRMRALEKQGLHLLAEVGRELPIRVDVVLLAVKPQMLDVAAPQLNAVLDGDQLIVSVIAGKTIADLRSRLPGIAAVVRCMPNLPASVGRGVTGCIASPEVSERQKQEAGMLLSAIGSVEWLAKEAHVDAVTAVSGSGPAYVFLLVETLAKAGEDLGLAPDLAMRLARATIEGAGELLYRDKELPAAQLRKNVTSPAGTTAAALEILMAEDGLEPLMRKAVAAAHRRAGELSG
jgi:pyrroline-5-carboxylate reductase